MPDLEQITILDKLKLNETGKAPPVLVMVRINDEEEAKAVLMNAKKVRNVKIWRNVYIFYSYTDIIAEKRAERKALMEALKKKIQDFPQQYRIIRVF